MEWADTTARVEQIEAEKYVHSSADQWQPKCW